MIFATILLSLTLLLVVFQLTVYWLVFNKISYYKEENRQHEPDAVHSVSVIICARNEAGHLQSHLLAILSQEHPQFEVLVVDDGSTDHTGAILAQMKERFPQLRILHLHDNREKRSLKGKKFALLEGLKAARYNHVLLTDADCYPLSGNWIHSMTKHLTAQKQIVIGFSPYENRGGLLNQMIRFDAFYVALQYLSFAVAGLPYMGVGRNLAYDKRLVLDDENLQLHGHIASGDDDLLVQQIATSANTTVSIEPPSMVMSAPKTSLREWVQQKTRHVSTSTAYTPSMRVLLALLGFAQIVTFPCVILCLFISGYPVLAAVSGLALIFTKYTVFLGVMRRLRSRDLWNKTLIFDFLLSAFYFKLGILHATNKGQKDQWQ